MAGPQPCSEMSGRFVLRVQPEVVPQALADPLPWGVPSMSLAEGLFAALEMTPSRQINLSSLWHLERL